MESTSCTRIVTRNGFEYTRREKGKRLCQRSGTRIVPFRPGEGRSRRGPCPWTARRGTPRRSSRSRSPPAPSSSPSPISLAAPLSPALPLRRGFGDFAMAAASSGHEVPPMDGPGFSFGFRGVIWAGPSFSSGSKSTYVIHHT